MFKADIQDGHTGGEMTFGRNARLMKIERIHQTHIDPLTQLVLQWRSEINFQGAETKIYVPYFDPDDGGTNARLLLLLEKPGRGASQEEGSGFVSQDNDDLTAAAIKNFLVQAKIPRSEVVIWNAVAAWNGGRNITKDELTRATTHLQQLLVTLPNLRAVVCVGNKAEATLARMGDGSLLDRYIVEKSLHPSPINKNRRKVEWMRIPIVWEKAARLAGIN